MLNNPNEQKAFIIEQQEGDNRIKRLKERILLLPSLTQKERKELSQFVLIDDVVYKIRHELNKTD